MLLHSRLESEKLAKKTFSLVDRFARLGERYPDLTLGYHVHDMSGWAAASVLAALDAGERHFETSICGIGGVVASPEAIGNLATEDLVNMLNGCGVTTGILSGDAIAVAREVGSRLSLPVASKAVLHGERKN